MTSPPDLRASDADRDRTVGALRNHAAEGRLDLTELEARLEAALAARTHGELAALTVDLPPPRRHHERMRAPELRAYLAVMALLVAVWLVTGAGYFWPVWPMLGWGLPLAMGGRRLGRTHPPELSSCSRRATASRAPSHPSAARAEVGF